MADSPSGIVHTLIRIWTSQFAEAWESMAGSRPDFSVPELAKTPAVDQVPAEPPLSWYRFGFGKDPEIGFFVGSNGWEKIGAVVLQAAGVDLPSPEDIRGTCLEILNQAAAGLARNLAKQAGREILAHPGTESPAPLVNVPRTTVRFRLDENDLELLLAGAEDLPSLLHLQTPIDKPVSLPAKPQAQELNTKMDLLLDVELPVSVSFGHAQLALKDVLKLTTGSIVELNRSVSEPVEVIVNNCVIARGEVVVVEGNFGVRIRHVVSRQERLQSIK